MAKKAWIVTWRNIDPSREEALGSRVYSSEAGLKRAVFPAIKGLAKTEREAYELSAEAEEMLFEVENAQDFWTAYDSWAEYAQEFDPDESLEIEETTIRG